MEEIATKYSSGEMLSGEIKKIMADTVIGIIEAHNTRRALVTDEILKRFYDIDKFN